MAPPVATVATVLVRKAGRKGRDGGMCGEIRFVSPCVRGRLVLGVLVDGHHAVWGGLRVSHWGVFSPNIKVHAHTHNPPLPHSCNGTSRSGVGQ